MLRSGFGLLLVCLLSGAATAPTAVPNKAQALAQLTDLAEIKLVKSGDYAQTLKAAYWAAGIGEPIVGILAKMLVKEKTYIYDSAGRTSAFPFNAIWALGHIATPTAIAALKKYQKGPHDHDASFAIKAAELRRKNHDVAVGVTARDEVPLYASSSNHSKVLRTLKRGTPVRTLAFYVVNKAETGPSGGTGHFDRVKLLPKGPTGFLERAGDDFATTY